MNVPPLPDGWRTEYDPVTATVWYVHVSGLRQVHRPMYPSLAQLPPGWITQTDAHGAIWYIHVASGHAQQNPPATPPGAFVPPAVAPTAPPLFSETPVLAAKSPEKHPGWSCREHPNGEVVWIHLASGQPSKKEPPFLPPDWTMEWSGVENKFYFVNIYTSVRQLTLPLGAVRAKSDAPKNNSGVKKVVSGPNVKSAEERRIQGERAAERNCKRYINNLTALREKMYVWLNPKSANKTLGMRLSAKVNPEKQKRIQLDKATKNQVLEEFRNVRKDFRQFMQDWNRYSKQFGERNYATYSLSLGEFKEELIRFQQRLVKTETTHEIIAEILALFQDITIEVHQSFEYKNTGSMTADVSFHDQVEDDYDQVTNVNRDFDGMTNQDEAW